MMMDQETKPTNSCKRHESLCRLCRCGSDCFSETLSGKLIVTKENVPFENLMDYFITSTEREEKDDGFYMMNMERTITIYRKVILEPTQL
ncbi:hypothetical protein QZH41_013356 [Actinostola sp. cb2023]|nr:hypothetical protein QZH41_013356 [Actinostola sp. cb2023]